MVEFEFNHIDKWFDFFKIPYQLNSIVVNNEKSVLLVSHVTITNVSVLSIESEPRPPH